MPDVFWAWTAGVVAAVAAVTALMAMWPGPPPGRWLLGAFFACLSGGLAWIACMQLGATPDWLDSAVWRACVVLAPLAVAVAVRFGQPLAMLARGGIVPLVLSTAVAGTLLLWGAGAGTGVVVVHPEGEDPVLGLLSGPARAAAVAMLLSTCYSVVRLYSVLGAARRAGLATLAHASLAVSSICALLFLVASQLLLYGALPLELLSFGSLALLPLCFLCAPALVRRGIPRPVLPPSAQLQSSVVLLLVLGLFLIALAGAGQFVHEVMPSQGLLWFRWGAVTVMLLLLALVSVPGVRRPLAGLVDRDLGPGGWDFRREWTRANEVLADAESIEDLVGRVRSHLASLVGAQRVLLWWGDAGGDLAAHPVQEGLAPMGPANPIRPRLKEAGGVLEVVFPARHLDEVPIVVENREAVETLGLRIFVRLSARGREGVLGLAPPGGFRLDNDQSALLKNLAGMVAAYARFLEPHEPEVDRMVEPPVRGDAHGTR